MGNTHDKPVGEQHRHSVDRHSSANNKIDHVRLLLEQIYQNITKGSQLLIKNHLDDIFDPQLAGVIFDLLANKQSDGVEKPTFVDFFLPLFKNEPGVLLDCFVAQGVEGFETFVHCCRLGVGVPFDESRDRPVLASFIHNVKNSKANSTVEETCRSYVTNFSPKMANSLQSTIVNSLRNNSKSVETAPCFNSTFLSPFTSWLLSCHLPPVYFPEAKNIDDSSSEGTGSSWTLLYDTRQHGLSVNRFEAKVFNYRSPTVSFIELSDQRIVALGADQEWKCSPQHWGGPYCFVFEISPKFVLLEQNSKLLYFNTKLHSCTSGILAGSAVKPHLKIEEDFSNVVDIEVWGVGSQDSLSAQASQRTWEKRQAEKHAKVPLPGNWNENADKAILEMGRTRDVERFDR